MFLNWLIWSLFARLRALLSTGRSPIMQPMLNIAIRAARSAGDLIIRRLNKLPQLHIESKAPNDYVSEVDRQAESLIIDELIKAYPNHGVIAEESGIIEGSDEFKWIIDPLDGTTNYLHGFPQYAVSIACQKGNRLEHGVIYDPFKQELFAASRGSGATLNNRKIRVANGRSTEAALLATGFPFRHKEQLDSFLQQIKMFFETAGDVRRAGAAALDLAYVAAGRLDGYWENNLQSWDIAAGALIVREAGGMVTDYDGNEHFLERGEVVAANPKVLSDMLRKLKSVA